MYVSMYIIIIKIACWSMGGLAKLDPPSCTNLIDVYFFKKYAFKLGNFCINITYLYRCSMFSFLMFIIFIVLFDT